MERVIKKIIVSPTAPCRSNVLWLQGTKLFKKVGSTWIQLNRGNNADGYEEFFASNGLFSASDGAFYVKL